MQKRRSIRSFTEKLVSKEQISSLLQAGLLAASSRSLRPWELVVVTDSSKLQELSRAKAHGSAFLKNAPLGIVILGIPEKSDVWIEDTSIVAANMLLEAEALGLGACWIQIRNRKTAEAASSEEAVKTLLGIPDSRSVEAIIAVGNPAEDKPGYRTEDLKWEKVYWEAWNSLD